MTSITRRSTGPVQRRTDTAQNVLDAAQRLLGTGVTYTELSVQRLIEEAGVARSSFYAHFPDKTQLLLALADRLSVVAYDALDEWSPEHDDALPALIEDFTAVMTHYRDQAEVLAAVLEVAGYDQEVRRFWGGQLDLFRDRVLLWLAAEQAAGRCPSSLDRESAARIMVDGGMRMIADQVIEGDLADDDRMARELSLFWWHGMFRRP